MTKKLTDGQKRARAAIKASVRHVLKELDRRSDEAYVDFATYFHMDCIRYDKAKWYGEPMGMNWPIFVCRRTSSPSPLVAQIASPT